MNLIRQGMSPRIARSHGGDGHHQSITRLVAIPPEITRVEGTNVVRVPFGVRRPRRHRPVRRQGDPTLVLPLVANLTPTPPPQAA